MRVYHVELRAFPNVARAFNLDRETLDTRFVRPWVDGQLIEFQDRRWSPEKTRLKVLEGEEIEAADVGMGRGWGTLAKRSRDVTDRVLAEVRRGAEARPEVEALKVAIAEVASHPIAFSDVMAMAGVAQPVWRASEQLGLAEQAVWEMLHQGRLEMLSSDVPVARERWQAVVLSWATWAGESAEPIRLHSLGAG
jgi:hypothetical protein